MGSTNARAAAMADFDVSRLAKPSDWEALAALDDADVAEMQAQVDASFAEAKAEIEAEKAAKKAAKKAAAKAVAQLEASDGATAPAQ